MEKKIWYYVYQELWNFDLRREKNMVDYQKLSNFNLLWKKL